MGDTRENSPIHGTRFWGWSLMECVPAAVSWLLRALCESHPLLHVYECGATTLAKKKCSQAPPYTSRTPRMFMASSGSSCLQAHACVCMRNLGPPTTIVTLSLLRCCLGNLFIIVRHSRRSNQYSNSSWPVRQSTREDPGNNVRYTRAFFYSSLNTYISFTAAKI